MTLGPKFFYCNKMAVTRRSMHPRKRKALILKALVETHLSSYSKRDLKQFPKNDLGFASCQNQNSLTIESIQN